MPSALPPASAACSRPGAKTATGQKANTANASTSCATKSRGCRRSGMPKAANSGWSARSWRAWRKCMTASWCRSRAFWQCSAMRRASTASRRAGCADCARQRPDQRDRAADLSIDQTIKSDAQKELREIEARMAELHRAPRGGRGPAQAHRIARADCRCGARTDRLHGGRRHRRRRDGNVDRSEGRSADHRGPLSPVDIDQIKLGQASMLRFPAFNLRMTPEAQGTVTRIAADLTK